jgi:aminoglycoside phosphotransferase family enzyme/predicted kinase
MNENLQPLLLKAMADPAFYPHRVTNLSRRETHISVVYLTGDFVYKIKKPVDLGFLDFSTLEKRRRFCELEVQLNRRLSKDIYLAAVALTHDGRKFHINGSGETVEWAVQMRQLPSAYTLKRLLADHTATESDMKHLAAHLAEFHGSAPRVYDQPTWSHVKAACDENFRQVQPHEGRILDRTRLAFIRNAVSTALDRHHNLIDKRTASGYVRDGHGDLRAEHIYFTGQCEIQILDCIEFNDRLRLVDVASDLAFLAMDLDHLGESRFARCLIEAYCRKSGDATLLGLMDFYKCYRAMVRCKVSCIQLSDTGLSRGHRHGLADLATGYLNLAYTYARHMTTPTVWVFCGLPGSGKSAISSQLAEALDIVSINSDEIRKMMFGLRPHESTPGPVDQGIYSTEAGQKVYDRLLSSARAEIQAGHSVILDATYSASTQRQNVLRLADDCGARILFVECRAPEAVLHDRLRQREHTPTVSDARLAHFDALKSRFEPLTDIPDCHRMALDTTEAPADCLNTLFIEKYLVRMEGECHHP